MMKNKYFKSVLLLIPTAAVIVFGFNNCARYGQLSNDTGTTDSASLGSSSTTDTTDSQALGLPYALLSAEQTFASMMRVANITTVSTALNNEYNSRYGSLAAGNDLSMANGPLMLGSTSLGGEVCNSLLTSEKALADGSRNFFNGIDFTKGVSTVADTAYATSIRAMARSFWGRNETADELSMIAAYKADFITNTTAAAKTQAASSSALMLATCAAMISSFDAVSY